MATATALPTLDEVRTYLALHGIKEQLETAVNTVVQARALDPLADIAASLVTMPSSKTTTAGAGKTGAGKKFFLGANWKCKIETRAEATSLCTALCARASEIPDDVEVVLFVPMLFVELCRRLVARTNFAIGAQNVWDAGPIGGYTGCTTAASLADAGVAWAMLGHSDRRNTLGETSELIAQKASAALAAGLSVNLTIGETRAQREAGEHLATLDAQLAPVVAALASAGDAAWGRIVLAYEPVWAIGEGATPCTPEEAQAVHGHVRAFLSSRVSPEAATLARIAYTGSVSTANAPSFVALPDCDGFVCGRASLEADAFIAVARAGR